MTYQERVRSLVVVSTNYTTPPPGLVMIPASHMYLHGQQFYRKKIVVEKRADKKKKRSSEGPARPSPGKDMKKSTPSKPDVKKGAKEEVDGGAKEGAKPDSSEDPIKKKKKKTFELV